MACRDAGLTLGLLAGIVVMQDRIHRVPQCEVRFDLGFRLVSLLPVVFGLCLSPRFRCFPQSALETNVARFAFKLMLHRRVAFDLRRAVLRQFPIDRDQQVVVGVRQRLGLGIDALGQFVIRAHHVRLVDSDGVIDGQAFAQNDFDKALKPVSSAVAAAIACKADLDAVINRIRETAKRK